MNLYVHQNNMVMHIYIQFREIWFTETLLATSLLILNQLKGIHVTQELMMSFWQNLMCTTMSW